MPGIDFKHPRYQLNEPLGQGGMGAVWEAVDLETNELVAIKLLSEDSLADRRLFEGEVRTLSELGHENIVRLLDAGALGGRLFLVMERLQGYPLNEFLDQPKPGHRQIDQLLHISLGRGQLLGVVEVWDEQVAVLPEPLHLLARERTFGAAAPPSLPASSSSAAAAGPSCAPAPPTSTPRCAAN